MSRTFQLVRTWDNRVLAGSYAASLATLDPSKRFVAVRHPECRSLWCVAQKDYRGIFECYVR